MALFDTESSKGAPNACAILVIGALGVLIVLNRGLRTITASVGVGK